MDMVAHAYNPKAHKYQASLGYAVKLCFRNKEQNLKHNFRKITNRKKSRKQQWWKIYTALKKMNRQI